MSLQTRRALQSASRAFLSLLTKREVEGLERLPLSGPYIVAANHLAHLDPLLLLSSLPEPIEAMALDEAYFPWFVAWFHRLYDPIRVRRDGMDLRAVRLALACLKQGGILGIAPEGRISTTGALEHARGGAGFIALKSGVPVVPAAITGTEMAFEYWKRLGRPSLRLRFGAPFHPRRGGATSREQVASATRDIMLHIAALLPVEHQGAYRPAIQCNQEAPVA